MRIVLAFAAVAFSLSVCPPSGHAAPAGPYPVTKIIRVIDGDTVDIEARLQAVAGLAFLGVDSHNVQVRVRLINVDAPELTSKLQCERADALKAKAFAQTWLDAVGVNLVMVSKDNYSGRIDGSLVRGSDDLGAALIAAKLARPYITAAKRPPWCAGP